MKFFLFLIPLFFPFFSFAQFAPPAGQPGTTAIPADSPVFTAWATAIEIERGWINMTDQSLGKVELGEPENGLNAPDGLSIVSLGDGGIATLTFEKPIRNGQGYDFAVFENGFGMFLELAVVEVSSDGENFVQFPATSNVPTDVQVGAFGATDASLINNLAGKYVANFGTPFDLEELVGTPNLNLQKITHVRLIDVVGSIDDNWATYDQNDNPINDPFPTPFPSSGFDLDAVGVIHQNESITLPNTNEFCFSPNPVYQGGSISFKNVGQEELYLFDAAGKFLQELPSNTNFSTQNLASGVYFLKSKSSTKKLIVL